MQVRAYTERLVRFPGVYVRGNWPWCRGIASHDKVGGRGRGRADPNDYVMIIMCSRVAGGGGGGGEFLGRDRPELARLELIRFFRWCGSTSRGQSCGGGGGGAGGAGAGASDASAARATTE